ncbi:MAG: release factor glutamine methyltransferase [Alteromonadaceae bacterium]
MEVHSLQNKTIKQLINFGTELLKNHSDSAKLDAQVLLCFVSDKTITYLHTWPEEVLTENCYHLFDELLQRRLSGEPISYITGIKEFWSLPFFCSPATLIPRPDTEVLVEQVLMYGQQFADEPLNCLDLGTGTGAIALSLASEMSSWYVDAVDFSEEAITLAQKNAKNLGLANVDIFQSDWFSQVNRNKKFDIIVSNPPYIDDKDIHLTQGDVRFEPLSALVAESKGLADILKIVIQAKAYLSDSGALFLEHGYDQGDKVKQLLLDNGYSEAITIKDYSDHDRVTWAKANSK